MKTSFFALGEKQDTVRPACEKSVERVKYREIAKYERKRGLTFYTCKP